MTRGVVLDGAVRRFESPEYPFAGRVLDVGGAAMHFLDEGPRDAGPILFVHGNPTWSFHFRALIAALRETHRCVAPDHIGCGLSDKPGDDAYTYTLARRVDDLTALVDHLDLRDVTLVVHDWGGMIGCAWAVRHSERVRRVVVMNTAAFPNPKGRAVPPSLWLARNTAVGALLVRGANAFARGATRACTKRRRLTAEEVRGYLAPYDSWAHRIATLRFVQDIPLEPRDPAFGVVEETARCLDRLACKPMLIFWGLRDFVFDAAFCDEWVRRFPGAELHRYEDCGHYVLDDAADRIVPRVRDWLAATA